MTDNELLQAIRQVVAEEVAKQVEPIKQDVATLKQDVSGLKVGHETLARGQSKMQAQIQGVKAEMHERFDKLETITEYALKEIDFLDQAYKQL